MGVETPVDRELGIPPAPLPEIIDPMQIIDDVAWSNEGGKEYVRSSEQEISETPGFNPDAISRVAYFGENPMLGLRVNSDGVTVPTRTADESWIYGESIAPAIDLTYSDTLFGAPTDPGGDGFQDISIGTGSDAFTLTPGGFNDHAPTGITQFRFVDGDLDFDADADTDDLALFDAVLLGADFNATEDYIDPDTGSTVPDPDNPGQNIQAYVFQGRIANAFLAAACLSDLDGTDVPGADDRAALVAITGEPCVGDLDDDGTVGFADLNAFVAAFQSGDPAGDLDDDGIRRLRRSQRLRRRLPDRLPVTPAPIHATTPTQTRAPPRVFLCRRFLSWSHDAGARGQLRRAHRPDAQLRRALARAMSPRRATRASPRTRGPRRSRGSRR